MSILSRGPIIEGGNSIGRGEVAAAANTLEILYRQSSSTNDAVQSYLRRGSLASKYKRETMEWVCTSGVFLPFGFGRGRAMCLDARIIQGKNGCQLS